MSVKALSTSRLHATFDPNKIPWEDSRDIPLPKGEGRHNTFQPRAMQALQLALQIRANGYNVYLSGETGLGRTYMLLPFLRQRAKKMQVSPDLVYVHNFSDEDHPLLLSLPAGQGKKFKKLMAETIEGIGHALSKRFEAVVYVKERAKLVDQFQKLRTDLLHKMTAIALQKGFNLDMDDNGELTLYPLADGKRLNDDEIKQMDPAIRLNFKRAGNSLAQDMASYMRQLNKAEKVFHEEERELERRVMGEVLDAQLSPIARRMQKSCDIHALEVYFSELREDILKNTEHFLQRDGQQNGERGQNANEDFFYRYEVNLFVDNAGQSGAPIVVEDNPTVVNLLGCVEREAEMGVLVTNFTLIKAGSLHKANGGFLVLHIDDLLQHPNAWEGLLRALRSNQARIEDGDELSDSAIRTKGIMPAPLPLNLKVVLIGNEDIYESLLVNDDRFPKLFRIKAHMTDVAERTADNIRRYLTQIAFIIDDDKLCPFDKSALAWLVDHGCHLSEDQRRLSLQFSQLRELMVEAAALADMGQAPMVTSAILEDAYGARAYRANLVEEIFMEEYDREMIKVRTSGAAVGQANGLSVTCHGNFEFGLPHRISCTVGVGQEGIIDLEREAELGGPIHTKAMMILKSYLINLFARKKPLMLTGSLYFEQSYVGIEGDSASGAELVALLSALAEVPVRLDLAFTGAVSHSGQIMAVGGVTRKIEGFYKVCARHGLTGSHGVIIPYDNVDHLMLAPQVLEAVANKQFAVYPVRHIEEALQLLTGLPAGRPLKNGGFTKGSLFDRVDKRLQHLGEDAQNAFKRTRRS